MTNNASIRRSSLLAIAIAAPCVGLAAMAATAQAQTVAANEDVVIMRRVLVPPNGARVAPPAPTPTATPTPTPAPQSAGTWTVGAWAFDTDAPTCSDAAQRSRTVACVADGVTVADARCTDARPPTTERVERLDDCTTAWTTGEYGDFAPTCSATAVRTRTVQCQRSGGDSATVIVDDALCGGERPSADETTGYFAGCTTAWDDNAAWGPWTDACSATATRTRTVVCRRSDGTTVADEQCMATRPPATQTGNLSSCGFHWGTPSAWSNDGAVCNSAGVGTRTVQCLRDDGVAVPDASCDAATRPSVSDTTPITAGCTVDWVASGYGAYDSSCSSTATRTQTVQCQRYGAAFTPAVLPDGQCNPATRPAESDTTKRFLGCTYTWHYSDYGSFNSTCSATATRTRTADCRRSNPATPSAILAADIVAPDGSCGTRAALSESVPNFSDCGGVLDNPDFEAAGLSGWTLGGANGVPVAVVPGASGAGAAARFIKAQSTVSQTVNTYPVNYSVTFSAYGTAGYPVRLFWNGMYINKCGVGLNNGWTSCSFIVPGVAGSSTIMFQGPPVSTQARIDDVVLAVAP